LAGDNLKTLCSFFLIYSLSIANAADQPLICSGYLLTNGPQTLPIGEPNSLLGLPKSSVIGTLKLPLSEAGLKAIKSNILKEKIWAFEGLILQDISDYLTLHKVFYEVDKKKQEIIISTHGASKLNRFARRISKMSEAFRIQGHRIQPTLLVFNARLLKVTKSRGAFVTKYIQPNEDHVDPDFSEDAELTNQIELSIAAIIQLAPTNTEFHEFIHWKSFVNRLKSKVETLSFGNINIKAPSSKYDDDDSSRFSFSLEEFLAHLIILNKSTRALSKETDVGLREDLNFEINGDIKALVLYAQSLKPLLLKYFEKSAFTKEDSPVDVLNEVLGISASMEELEVVRFDLVEQFALFYPPGAKIGLQTLEYQLSDFNERSWISIVLPLPNGFEDIQDFREWFKPENKDGFRFISQALFYKMSYLLKLVDHIELLNAQLQRLGAIQDSPIRHFYELEREYKNQIERMKEKREL
jgi:predicted transcriptional regulator